MPRNLLHTHIFIWYINGSPELSRQARALIEGNGALNFVSIASLWEIAIKISLGKLVLKAPFEVIHSLMIQNGFKILPVTVDDTLQLATLPFFHRDPFDRILIVQAMLNELTLITNDQQISAYSIKVAG